MMRRFSVVFAAIAAVGLLGAPARASVWTSSISYDGIMDVIQDNSVSVALIDSGGPGGAPDGIVSVGDVIAGIVKWNVSISDAHSIPANTLAVFAVQVTSVNGAGSTVLGGNPTVNFSVGPVAGVLDAMLPTVSAAVGGFGASAVGAILSHLGGTDPTTLGLGAALGLIDTTYDPDLIFGFKTASDYFEAELRDHRKDAAVWTGLPAGLGQDGVISIKDTDGDGFADEFDDSAVAGPGLSILPGVGVTGAESGGFSVLADFTGPGTAAYLQLPTTQLDGSAGPGTGSTQLILSSTTTLVQPTNAQSKNGYIFADQSIIALNAVPEPLSMLVWAGLAGVFGVVIARRRRSA
jgi:hypothetical protein